MIATTKEITDVNKLQAKINEVIFGINYLDRGVQFFSPYHGVIQTTTIDNTHPKRPYIYGFDLEDGLPRSNDFPGEITWIGFPINLEVVIQLLNNKADYFHSNYDVKENLVEITFNGHNYFEWQIGNGLEDQNSNTLRVLEEIVESKSEKTKS